MSGTVHVPELAESKLPHLVQCDSAVHREHHDKLGGLVEWRKLLRPERGSIRDGLGLGGILGGNESRTRNVAHNPYRILAELVPSDILGGSEFRYHTPLLDKEFGEYKYCRAFLCGYEFPSKCVQVRRVRLLDRGKQIAPTRFERTRKP
jgi:hypothetical protein